MIRSAAILVIVPLLGLGLSMTGAVHGADKAPAQPVPAAKAPPVIDLGSRLELFVDHHLIQSIEGDGKLYLHRPKPQEVSLTTDLPWEGNTSAYYTLFQDEDIYRMYYRGSHYDVAAKKATHPEVTCYAQSRDGIYWEKPNLGLIEYNGSKDNNIVWDGIGTHCFTVFKDANPDCPAQARYKAISRGRPQGKKGLYVFQSPDGFHWTLIRPEPVITEGAFDSQNLAFWDDEARLYRAFFRTFVKGIRAIFTSTSTDYVTWSKPVLVTYGNTPNQHLYTNATLPYDRAPHVLIAFPTRYLPDQGNRVEPTFMSSRDGGLTFHRWLEAVIPESAPEDREGNRSNYMTWGVLTLPDQPGELSVYATEAYYQGPDSRVRRFTYRTDGFVSFRAGAPGAILVSKLLTFSGRILKVNYATTDPGELRVGLRGADGKPIKGFSLRESMPLSGDSTGQVVSWKSGGNLDLLIGKPVRVVFQLKNGDLYSFQFDKNKPDFSASLNQPY